MPILKLNRSRKVSVTVPVRNEEHAFELYLRVENKKSEKILARYIWQGSNPEIILQLADSMGIPKKWRVSVAKRMAILGSGEQVLKTLGWMGWKRGKSSQARDILVRNLLDKPQQEWEEAARKEASKSNSFLRPEEITVLLPKAA